MIMSKERQAGEEIMLLFDALAGLRAIVRHSSLSAPGSPSKPPQYNVFSHQYKLNGLLRPLSEGASAGGEDATDKASSPCCLLM